MCIYSDIYVAGEGERQHIDEPPTLSRSLGGLFLQGVWGGWGGSGDTLVRR